MEFFLLPDDPVNPIIPYILIQTIVTPTLFYFK